MLWSDPGFDAINPRPLGLHVEQWLSYALLGLTGMVVVLTLAG